MSNCLLTIMITNPQKKICNRVFTNSQQLAQTLGYQLALRRLKFYIRQHQATSTSPPNITVNGQSLGNVDKFHYLGRVISQNANIDNEIVVRLAKASAALGRLYDNF